MALSPLRHVSLAILGAGLTGLSAALESQRLGVSYRLFERETQAGGLARTREDQGYRFDRTGHLLHVGDEALEREVIEWLGEEPLRLRRESRIWSHGVYTHYPFQANTHGLPPRVIYECLMGFIQAQQTRHHSVPRNFEEYCQRHFGSGISEHFMIPYNSRLWGVPPSDITADWCQRFVPLPTLEDVVAGALGEPRRRLGYNVEFLYPALGIGQLAAALRRRLGSFEARRAPERIDWRAKTLVFSDEHVRYQHLVSSIPLSTLLGLCLELPEPIQRAARALRATHLYYLDVALFARCPQEWHWVYVPESKYPFYRVGCYSNFSERMAPPGSGNLYVELTDRAPPDLDQLLPLVMQGLQEMRMIGRVSDVRFVRLGRIDHAYVIFDHAHAAATQAIHEFLREHCILSTGRYGEWTYASMEDALLSGRRAVGQL